MVKELIERKFPTLSLALKAQCGFESIESLSIQHIETSLKHVDIFTKEESCDERERITSERSSLPPKQD